VSTRPRIPFALASLLSFAAGLLCSLAFPPAELWPIAFLAPAILLFLLRDARPARGFALGLIFGLAFFGATLYWIWRFGAMAWLALSLVSAASVAVFGALAPCVTRAGATIRNAVGVAVLWTVIDWIRGAWPLGGFTWGSLGISQVDNRTLLPLASITGVWGMTFVVVAAASLVADAALGGGGGRRRLARAAGAAVLLVAPVAIPFPQADGPAVDVAALQVDVRVPPGTSSLNEDLAVAQRLVALHRTLIGEPRPDLVVWGEGSLDPGASADPTVVSAVERAIRAVGAPASIGAVVNDPDGRQLTSDLLFDGNGELVDRYDKVHLVPFGEYVPWRRWLGWVQAIRQVPIDRAPGANVHTVDVPGLAPFGTPICFENAFPAITRAFARAGATFFVVPVNNASYGFTAASDQHLQMSRMRAVETGRWFVDAAVSGVSAFIDPGGAVTEHTELFQTAVLRGSIRTSSASTLYVRLGDWVPWLALVAVVALFLAPPRRGEKRRLPRALTGSPRTLVVLPTYEERETIEAVVARVLALPEHVDVVVIDDASPDGTGEIVRAIAATEPRVRLVERPGKSGLGSAYLAGFGLALDEGYEIGVEMDSDLSHDPTELSSLLAAAGANDLVVGSRYVPGGSVTNWSRSRVWLSRAGNAYTRLMLGVPIHDATSGYRAYRRELLADILSRPLTSDGYGFQIELVLRADRSGYAVGEVPITFREREHGRSKISRRMVVEALWLVTRWGSALRFNRGPAA
jgi:apolipoprotein N-acyltransferase